MRLDDWSTFSVYNIASDRSPEFVAQVIFDDETLSITSQTGISNLVGTVLDGVASGISSGSQKFFPLDGRAQIGGITIKLLDNSSPSTFTEKVRAQLESVASPAHSGESLRNKEVRIFMGYTGDFDDFVHVATSYVNGVSYNNGEYSIACVDVTRQLRKSVFEPAVTRLSASIVDPSVSPQPDIAVTTVDGFEMLQHTASFTDAPSQTVGYFEIEETGEIIRYTGISQSPPAFTGITREVFGTVGGAVTVDTSEDESNWAEVEEHIYIEMPAIQIAYGVITGKVLGSSPEIQFPTSWNMGIDPAKIAVSEWENIGTDIYDGDTGGIVLRFRYNKKTDGKKFIETEIHKLIGTFSPINQDGSMGLARINPVLSGSSYVAVLDEASVTKATALKHVTSEVYNQYRIDYGWDGERFTDSLLLVDSDSISRNDTVGTKVLKFKGLHTSAHSQTLIYSMINALQNRYRNPPQQINISVLPKFDILEPNDIIHLDLDHVQDYAGAGAISRVFEIQSVKTDWVNGRVDLSLFASSGTESDPLIRPPAAVLADAFYTSKGTDIASISPSIVSASGHITSDCTLSGNADMNDAASIYYYDGDLTIDSGVTLTITDNVQLRVKGTLNIVGDIDGSENGKLPTTAGVGGYVGNVRARGNTGRTTGNWWYAAENKIVEGINTSFPALSLNAGDQTASPVPTDIAGIPSDLRGAGGCDGGRMKYKNDYTQYGTAGGQGGAGLCIIARLTIFGVSGNIELNGGDAASQQTAIDVLDGGKVNGVREWWVGGVGAVGGQGSLLILTDGANDLPDLLNHFDATTGASVEFGQDSDSVGQCEYTHNFWESGDSTISDPRIGYPTSDSVSIDRKDISVGNVYIPESS